MTTKLSIGDFSRMTYLSVKALRHYHDVGVLEPAEIDPATGYRFYLPSQVGLAQMIRRLRDLGMPLDEVRTIMDAPDASTRDATLVAHLQRMEEQLAQTQQTVASLRTLLQQQPEALAVERRPIPATAALAITEIVDAPEAVAWWMDAFTVLHKALASTSADRAGPDGALFPSEFFEEETGEVIAFVPVDDSVSGALPARVQQIVVPAISAAVTVHDGPFGDLDRTYGALGTWVLERAAGADGPIREYYLPTGDPDDLLAHTTEVCWPVRPSPDFSQSARAPRAGSKVTPEAAARHGSAATSSTCRTSTRAQAPATTAPRSHRAGCRTRARSRTSSGPCPVLKRVRRTQGRGSAQRW